MEALENNKSRDSSCPQKARRNVEEKAANCRQVEIYRESKGRGDGQRRRHKAADSGGKERSHKR